MLYLLYSIILKISNLLREEVHCQEMKLHRKSSTGMKYLRSMLIWRNLNTKLIAKKSKGPQRPGILRDKQTSFIKNKSIQCNIQKDTEMYPSQNEMSVYSDEGDNESINDVDSSFVLSKSDSSSCSDFDSNDNKDDTKSTAFIVFWSSLIILFGKGFTCFDKSVKITRKVCGSLRIILMTCSKGHKSIWRFQPSNNRQSLADVLNCSGTLFSANTFQRIYGFFRLVWLQCIEKSRFYQF